MTTQSDQYDAISLPAWYQPDTESMTGIADIALAMFGAEVPAEFASVAHPARRFVQGWVDARSAAGINPVLLHQIQPRDGAQQYSPTKCITMAAVVLATPRISVELRLRLAAMLVHDRFTIGAMPAEYHPDTATRMKSGRKAA